MKFPPSNLSEEMTGQFSNTVLSFWENSVLLFLSSKKFSTIVLFFWEKSILLFLSSRKFSTIVLFFGNSTSMSHFVLFFGNCKTLSHFVLSFWEFFEVHWVILFCFLRMKIFGRSLSNVVLPSTFLMFVKISVAPTVLPLPPAS